MITKGKILWWCLLSIILIAFLPHQSSASMTGGKPSVLPCISFVHTPQDTTSTKKIKRKLTRKEILRLKTEDVLNMSFDEVEELLQTMGVSSLEELLNMLVKVATSSKGQTLRESPGIVTLITEEEIANSGARDMIDVLRLVPGFQFGMDVQGAVGVGMRGNWGHEGKILLLLDGQEMNENLYATTQFGNHYPVELIKQVEIIRGPGSAIYGGFAELAVINIITKGADDLNGIFISGTYGQMEKTFARRNLTLGFGKTFDEVKVSGSVFVGQGQRSDQDYTDWIGNTYNMIGQANLNPFNINTSVDYKDLHIRFIYDLYDCTHRSQFGVSLPRFQIKQFYTTIADAKYDIHINPQITLTPRINYRYYNPWYTDDEQDTFFTTGERLTGNLTLNYDITPTINLLVGGGILDGLCKNHLSLR